MATQWEYRVRAIKIPQIRDLERWLGRYGAAGWEVVSLTTTVKTWMNVTGNDIVVIMKRPTDHPADVTMEPDTRVGWHPDPAARHQLRYFDGDNWTDHVADNDEVATDPLGDRHYVEPPVRTGM